MPVKFTYHLSEQCGNVRPFCRTCVNAFSIDQCGPTGCDVEPPITICLKPRFGLDDDSTPLPLKACCNGNGLMIAKYAYLLNGDDIAADYSIQCGIGGGAGVPEIELPASLFGGNILLTYLGNAEVGEVWESPIVDCGTYTCSYDPVIGHYANYKFTWRIQYIQQDIGGCLLRLMACSNFVSWVPPSTGGIGGHGCTVGCCFVDLGHVTNILRPCDDDIEVELENVLLSGTTLLTGVD